MKSYDKPRHHIKKHRHHFANKVHIVKTMVFPVVMYRFENCTIRKVAEKLMPLNCSAGEDSWESLGQQGNQTSHSNEYSGLISFRLGLTGLISLLFKGFSRVFSSTAIQGHQFFSTQPSLHLYISHICTRLLEKPQLWLGGPLLAKWCLCFWYSV